MSGIPLETCWAFNERWNNKFCYKVAPCWLFLLNQLRVDALMSQIYFGMKLYMFWIWILQESRWKEGMNEGIYCFITLLAFSHLNIAFINEVNVKDSFEVLASEELFVHCWFVLHWFKWSDVLSCRFSDVLQVVSRRVSIQEARHWYQGSRCGLSGDFGTDLLRGLQFSHLIIFPPKFHIRQLLI